MGLFVRDDTYDESQRMTGFNRYKQLLSFYGLHWVKLNIITFVVSIPLILGITYSLLSTSLLLLIPLCIILGALTGPFVGALVDNIYRAMRDDSGLRWDNYKKGLRQNFRCSLLPGAILGLFIGTYSYILYLSLFSQAIVIDSFSMVALTIALILFLNFENLFWPQLVLFNQPLSQTIINIILFTCKHLWKVAKIILLQLIFISFHVMFAPYTFLLLPFLSIWYFIFVSQFLLYDTLNEELKIEEKFI
ncbi:MAG: hypothetical protein K6E79_04160 [Pseudobutyrivibrio sp.]|nr:hypothetical protein [Pseudobutyrivibrio sp.]